VHQVGDQPGLYYEARSTNHQDECEIWYPVPGGRKWIKDISEWVSEGNILPGYAARMGHIKEPPLYLGSIELKGTPETHYHKILGHAVSQLIETMLYKSEGRGFDSRWCNWNLSLTYSFRPHYGPGVDSASNRIKYQEYFLGVKAAGA
jgi:hypothetical protein